MSDDRERLPVVVVNWVFGVPSFEWVHALQPPSGNYVLIAPVLEALEEAIGMLKRHECEGHLGDDALVVLTKLRSRLRGWGEDGD